MKFGPEAGWVATLGVIAILVFGYGCFLWTSRTFLLGGNLYEVIPGQVYRSARLQPADLDRLIGEKGLKTVVIFTNGIGRHPWTADMKRVCDARRVGLELIALPADHRADPGLGPPGDRRHRSSRCPRPMLVEGYRGIDQVGFAAAVTQLLGGSPPPRPPLRQFDRLKYGQFNGAERIPPSAGRSSTTATTSPPIVSPTNPPASANGPATPVPSAWRRARNEKDWTAKSPRPPRKKRANETVDLKSKISNFAIQISLCFLGDLGALAVQFPRSTPPAVQGRAEGRVADEALIRAEADGQGDGQDGRGLPEGMARHEVEVALEQAEDRHVDQVDPVRAVGQVAQGRAGIPAGAVRGADRAEDHQPREQRAPEPDQQRAPPRPRARSRPGRWTMNQARATKAGTARARNHGAGLAILASSWRRP